MKFTKKPYILHSVLALVLKLAKLPILVLGLIKSPDSCLVINGKNLKVENY